ELRTEFRVRQRRVTIERGDRLRLKVRCLRQTRPQRKQQHHQIACSDLPAVRPVRHLSQGPASSSALANVCRAATCLILRGLSSAAQTSRDPTTQNRSQTITSDKLRE